MNARDFDRAREIVEAGRGGRRGAYDERKHPRDRMGRFTSAMGGALRSGARAIGRSARTPGKAQNLGGSFGRGFGLAVGRKGGGIAGRAAGTAAGRALLMDAPNRERAGRLGASVATGLGGVLGSRLGRDAGNAAGRAVGARNNPNIISRALAGLSGYSFGVAVGGQRGGYSPSGRLASSRGRAYSKGRRPASRRGGSRSVIGETKLTARRKGGGGVTMSLGLKDGRPDMRVEGSGEVYRFAKKGVDILNRLSGGAARRARR